MRFTNDELRFTRALRHAALACNRGRSFHVPGFGARVCDPQQLGLQGDVLRLTEPRSVPAARFMVPMHVKNRNEVPQAESAFTMIEIAICLAIIGVALVAIIGVLPFGMRTQSDNREQTVINQDATMLVEAMRGGAQGLDDLTNYVYAITNYWAEYRNGRANPPQADGYSYSASQIRPRPGMPTAAYFPLTNGLRIIGLMSMPEYVDTTPNAAPYAAAPIGSYISNHVVAYVRSMSGPATEKPPQNNAIVVGGAFSYRVFCVNAPMAMDTNLFDTAIYTNGVPPYNQQLAASLHELRLTFLWPQYPNGGVGPGRWTCRTTVGGMIFQTNLDNQWLYFYQPQSFNNVVTTP